MEGEPPEEYGRAADDGPLRGRSVDLSPWARAPSFPCPFGACDGNGFVLEEESNVAKPCRCRAQRIALARSRSLDHEIPKKFQHVAFDRFPVTEMDPALVRGVRSYCSRIDEMIDKGQGIWFSGERGTGKTTHEMLISQHALKAHRSVVIYSAPRSMAEIRNTFEDDVKQTCHEQMVSLRAVELLHIEDLAV